jgi:DNA-directed RNA polymerase sigma subunit (sigma70/sigma32)
MKPSKHGARTEAESRMLAIGQAISQGLTQLGMVQMTQKEVAQRMNMSRTAVRRIEYLALYKLRMKMAEALRKEGYRD